MQKTLSVKTLRFCQLSRRASFVHGTEKLKKLPLSGELASECETERVWT